MAQSSAMQQRFYAWLSENPDETVLRWIFRVVVAVTIAVLAVDLGGRNGWIANRDASAAPAEIKQDLPVLNLPGMVPSILAPLMPGGDKRLVPLPQPDGAMARPMTFELVSGGNLMATGTITPGTSQSFAAELDKRGDYIKTVVLNSPGGSVTDAIIGVHQVAPISSAASGASRDEMSVAQTISARCQRYLGDMGVSLQAWVHAMETPHDKLFVFKPDELKSLNMVTAAPASAPIVGPAAAKSRL
jgi:hypothetical protein